MGQWFQTENGLHQNWMRDYDPTTGRYLQADPLGLIDSASIYGYATNYLIDTKGARSDLLFSKSWTKCVQIEDISLVPGTKSLQLDKDVGILGRSERIRTSDPCLPKTVLYQAELHSDRARRDSGGSEALQEGDVWAWGMNRLQKTQVGRIFVTYLSSVG